MIQITNDLINIMRLGDMAKEELARRKYFRFQEFVGLQGMINMNRKKSHQKRRRRIFEKFDNYWEKKTKPASTTEKLEAKLVDNSVFDYQKTKEYKELDEAAKKVLDGFWKLRNQKSLKLGAKFEGVWQLLREDNGHRFLQIHNRFMKPGCSISNSDFFADKAITKELLLRLNMIADLDNHFTELKFKIDFEKPLRINITMTLRKGDLYIDVFMIYNVKGKPRFEKCRRIYRKTAIFQH